MDTPEQRRELITALTSAVEHQDADFVSETLTQQSLIEPIFLAEYMDIKRRAESDPAAQARWAGALTLYMATTDMDSLSQEDKESFNELHAVIELQSELDHLVVEPELDWKAAEFRTTLTSEEHLYVTALPQYKRASAFAIGARVDPATEPLTMAHQIISTMSTSDQLLAAQALDVLVFAAARQYALETMIPTDPTKNQLDAALETINNYASSATVKELMHRCLDKHIYEHARAYALDKKISSDPSLSQLEVADEIIASYASSPKIAQYMKQELDPLVFKKATTYATDLEISFDPSIDQLEMAVSIIERHGSDIKARLNMRKELDTYVFARAASYASGARIHTNPQLSKYQMALQQLEYVSTPEEQARLIRILEKKFKSAS